MKQLNITFLLVVLMSITANKASAHDIEVKNDDGVTIYYNFINDNTELEVTYQGTYANEYSNEYTGKVVIPSSVNYNGKTYTVTSIRYYAFHNCSGLTSVEISESVKSIDYYAFQNCSSLTSVTIPNSVTIIELGTFRNCTGLTSVTIGNSVTSIVDLAFSGCSSLTSVTMQTKNPVKITSGVFTNRANATLYVPQGCKDAYKAADYWKEFKEIKEGLPTGVKAVENSQTTENLETSNWYTLDGRRLSGKSTSRGIYIVNGRKIVVK